MRPVGRLRPVLALLGRTAGRPHHGGRIWSSAWARPATNHLDAGGPAAVGVSIVTISQYLRPTSHHLPVARWWTPDDFAGFAAAVGRNLGIARRVEPVRSSYHARAAGPGRSVTGPAADVVVRS